MPLPCEFRWVRPRVMGARAGSWCQGKGVRSDPPFFMSVTEVSHMPISPPPSFVTTHKFFLEIRDNQLLLECFAQSSFFFNAIFVVVPMWPDHKDRASACGSKRVLVGITWVVFEILNSTAEIPHAPNDTHA